MTGCLFRVCTIQIIKYKCLLRFIRMNATPETIWHFIILNDSESFCNLSVRLIWFQLTDRNFRGTYVKYTDMFWRKNESYWHQTPVICMSTRTVKLYFEKLVTWKTFAVFNTFREKLCSCLLTKLMFSHTFGTMRWHNLFEAPLQNFECCAICVP